MYRATPFLVFRRAVACALANRYLCAMKLIEIEQEALALPVRERASLAAKLLGTLPPPGTEVSDAEVERRERESGVRASRGDIPGGICAPGPAIAPTMKAVYHPHVQRDVSRILQHYDAINDRLGDDFWEELNSFIRLATANPHRFHFEGANRRRVNLRRFPYHFLFREIVGGIRITVVPSPTTSAARTRTAVAGNVVIFEFASNFLKTGAVAIDVPAAGHFDANGRLSEGESVSVFAPVLGRVDASELTRHPKSETVSDSASWQVFACIEPGRCPALQWLGSSPATTAKPTSLSSGPISPATPTPPRSSPTASGLPPVRRYGYCGFKFSDWAINGGERQFAATGVGGLNFSDWTINDGGRQSAATPRSGTLASAVVCRPPPFPDLESSSLAKKLRPLLLLGNFVVSAADASPPLRRRSGTLVSADVCRPPPFPDLESSSLAKKSVRCCYSGILLYQRRTPVRRYGCRGF